MHPTVRAYVAAGYLTHEQMLEHARLKGEAAYLHVLQAIREERENSTAMVILPGEPPGKNTTGLIRRLVQDRTKLIVVTQQGSLPVGDFERLLRASVPDVEKKLRIMDGGASVAAAVDSAERNRHYRPSQALEVFADEQLTRNFTQEVHDGGLNFDPTVIMVHPTPIPTDDVEAIRKAVTGDDLDSMHRLLDPHIFSDADSLQVYKDVLRGGQARTESLQREFLTDIAPSRDLGIKKLDAMLRAELGDHFDELEYLGSGRNGSAYRTPDGLIIKVTTDPKEAESAERLQGERCEYIHHIHEVTQVSENVWIILQEGGLEKLPAQYREEFDLAMEIVEVIGAGHALRMGDAEGVREVMVNSGHTELCMLVAEVMKKFDVGGMLHEIAELGLSADFHSGNIMLREGRPVLTDLGTHGEDPRAVHEDSHPLANQQKYSHPWQAPEDVLKKHGVQLSFEENEDTIEVSVNDAQGEYAGSVSLVKDPDRNVWQITLSMLHNLPYGSGIGTSIYRAIREYVRKNHPGMTVASDYNRSDNAERTWSSMSRAGLAKPQVANRGGKKQWTYYAMEKNKNVSSDDDQQVHELAGIQAAPQAGPQSHMRGSNSSAWAGGRLVLSKPEAHVPEDENESERDGALDQDIIGGGLDWNIGLSKRGY